MMQVVAITAVERQPVVGARDLPVLHLGLGHGGAVVDIPQRGRVLLVRLAPGQVAQEPDLAGAPGAGVDRRVVVPPVHRQPEAPPELLEGLLVDGGQPLAQLDEAAPADRELLGRRLVGRHEVRVERDGGSQRTP